MHTYYYNQNTESKLKVIRGHTWWPTGRKVCTLSLLHVTICICKEKSPVEVVGMSVCVFFFLKKSQIVLEEKKKTDFG